MSITGYIRSVISKAIWLVLGSLVIGILFPEASLAYLLPLIPLFLAGMMGSAGLMITMMELFRSGIKPSKISIMLSSQFILSTSIGFVLALLFFNIMADLPDLALGQVLHGAMPSEQTTPVWIKLAGGNTALGIATLMLSTITSPFVSPVMVLIFAGRWIELDYVLMFESLLLTVMLPVVVGSLIRSARPQAIARYDAVFSAISLLSALPTVAIVGALAASFLSIQPLHVLLLALVASMAHFGATLIAGYAIPRILRWDASDAPVSIYNLSMKEFTVTLGVIATTGLSQEVGVPAALYGIMHMAAAPIIARWLSGRRHEPC
ncbi:MAG: bile acid:sodium symporter [Candidatus Nitrosocaldus sp.]|nr:bile acid:sodium symporter [Candidatus Nitrosocaldus sp.]MDW7999850.1 bile acid:sodium symporter [Candidatus Nitrosocaldus sp.]